MKILLPVLEMMDPVLVLEMATASRATLLVPIVLTLMNVTFELLSVISMLSVMIIPVVIPAHAPIHGET